MPLQREVARAFATLSLVDCRVLLRSPVHEHRLTAVLILIRQFEPGDEAHRAQIYRMLLGARRALDNWDLMHKAVGWMLREVGKRDVAALRAFLDRHAPTMPRTMLRYAIERLSPVERRAYLAPGTRIAARTQRLVVLVGV